MENPVRTLRKHLGMTQSRFALELGVSYATVQNYESGKRVPSDIVEKLKAIAAHRGFADVALILSSDTWQVQGVFHPGETLINAPVVQVPSSDVAPIKGKMPSRAELHAMLDEIIESGDPDAIRAVVPNLQLFAKWVRSLPKQEKTTAKKRRA